MAVVVEKPVQIGEEWRAVERRPKPDVIVGWDLGQDSANAWILSCRLSQRDQVERLLRADRPLAGGKLRVDEVFEWKPDGLADVPDRRLVEEHVGQQQHGLHFRRPLVLPLFEFRPQLGVGERATGRPLSPARGRPPSVPGARERFEPRADGARRCVRSRAARE